MDDVRPISEAEAERWDAFVAGHPLGTGLVTMAARDYWRQSRWTLQPLALWRGGAIVGGIGLCFKKIPCFPWTVVRVLAILPAGDDVVGTGKRILEAAERFSRERKAVEIESRCRVFDQYAINGIRYDELFQAMLGKAGYRAAAAFGGGTYVVRIDVDDEALLKSFSSKCRRDVRKGLREGVAVGPSESPDDLRVFCESYERLWRRKGLASRSFLGQEGIQALLGRGHFRLFVARYQDRICNMALLDALGVPRYLYGATTEAAFEKGVPPTGQALHFGAMQWFRDRGVQHYDLGGSPGPVPEKGHPNYTVWCFKHDFGGQFVWTIPYYRRALSLLGVPLMAIVRRLGRLK